MIAESAVNLHAKFGTTILYKSPRGSVLRTPATLNQYSHSPASQVVLIPVVLRNGYSPAESKLSPDCNHSSGTYKVNLHAKFGTTVLYKSQYVSKGRDCGLHNARKHVVYPHHTAFPSAALSAAIRALPPPASQGTCVIRSTSYRFLSVMQSHNPCSPKTY